jgi:hypothetical protein
MDSSFVGIWVEGPSHDYYNFDRKLVYIYSKNNFFYCIWLTYPLDTYINFTTKELQEEITIFRNSLWKDAGTDEVFWPPYMDTYSFYNDSTLVRYSIYEDIGLDSTTGNILQISDNDRMRDGSFGKTYGLNEKGLRIGFDGKVRPYYHVYLPFEYFRFR